MKIFKLNFMNLDYVNFELDYLVFEVSNHLPNFFSLK